MVKRRYRPNELLLIDKATNRIGNIVDVEKSTNKKINKTKKALNKSYEGAIEAIEKKDEPRQERKKKKVVKLDL